MNGYTPNTDLNILSNLGTNTFNNQYTTPIHPLATISQLNPNFTYSSFLGYSDTITPTYSEVNASGSIFDFTATNGLVNIVSSNNGDKLGSSGINTLLLNGLDTDYNIQTEIISLNGTTQVQTTNSFHRINSITPLSIGSNLVAVGNITLSANSSSNIHGKMLAGESAVYVGRYTIPNELLWFI